MFSNFIIYLLCFNSLFLLISTEQGAQKNIFDETNLKHLKSKNRFFRGSIGDSSFKNGKKQKKASNYMINFPKMKSVIYSQDIQQYPIITNLKM